MDEFGCPQCWSSSAAKAWEVIIDAPIESYLIDDAHYIVSIRRCPSCSQRYLQVTTETVDWIGGEDPICRTIIPIDSGERDMLVAAAPPTTSLIEAVGTGRQSLKRDSPSGEDPRIFWSSGVQVGIHD